MTSGAQNGLRVAGILLAALSIPLAWSLQRIGAQDVTINGMPASSASEMAKALVGSFGPVPMTGLHGSLVLGLGIPYWFIAALVCLTGILQLMANNKECRAPQAFMWTLSLVSLALTVAVVVIPFAFGKGYPEIGGFIVMLSALIMVLCMGVPSDTSSQASSAEG